MWACHHLEGILGNYCKLGVFFLLGFIALYVAHILKFDSPSNNVASVWVVDDNVKIGPIRGNVIEKNRYRNVIKNRYKNQNHIWDGSNRVVSLKGARNEYVAFQIVIEGPGKKLSNICVEATDLIGPTIIQSEKNISLYKEWYVNVETPSWVIKSLGKGWYPDALIPLGKNGMKDRLEIPGPVNNVPGQQNQAVWVDIYIPKTAKSGEYTSIILVKSESGELFEELNINLFIWDFSIPDQKNIDAYVGAYGNFEEKWSEEKRLRAYQLAHQHRLTIGACYIKPELSIKSGKLINIDWSSYDQRMEKYLDGSAFTEQYGYSGPSEGIPISFILLPFDNHNNHSWPLDNRLAHTKEYENIFIQAGKEFQTHFNEKGWAKTRLTSWFNGLDEFDLDQLEDVEYFGKLIKKCGNRKIEYRIDIDDFPSMGPDMLMERLGPLVDIWNFQGRAFDHKRAKIIQERYNSDIWFYQAPEPFVGTELIDGETIGLRTWGWIAWKYELDGFGPWSAFNKSIIGWDNPITYRVGDRVWNGDGLLIYSGEKFGLVDEVFPSIRLKSFRRGIQDYEYMALLTKIFNMGRPLANEIVNSIMKEALVYKKRNDTIHKGRWSHRAEGWSNARIKLGDTIHSKIMSNSSKNIHN